MSNPLPVRTRAEWFKHAFTIWAQGLLPSITCGNQFPRLFWNWKSDIDRQLIQQRSILVGIIAFSRDNRCLSDFGSTEGDRFRKTPLSSGFAQADLHEKFDHWEDVPLLLQSETAMPEFN